MTYQDNKTPKKNSSVKLTDLFNKKNDIFDSDIMYVNLKKVNGGGVFIRAKVFHTIPDLNDPDYSDITSCSSNNSLCPITSSEVTLSTNSNLQPSGNWSDAQVLNLYMFLSSSLKMERELKVHLTNSRGSIITYKVQLPLDNINGDPIALPALISFNHHLTNDDCAKLSDLFNYDAPSNTIHEAIYHSFIRDNQNPKKLDLKVKFFHVLKGFGLKNAKIPSDIDDNNLRIDDEIDFDCIGEPCSHKTFQVFQSDCKVKEKASKKQLKIRLKHNCILPYNQKFLLNSPMLEILTKDCDILIPPIP